MNHSPAETTQQPRVSEHDLPIRYWPSNMAYPDDEPIPYRLTESAPHFEDMDQRAREAGL